MKIAIYNKNDGSLAALYKSINNPYLNENNMLIFDNGSLGAFDDYHILLDDVDSIPDNLSDAKKINKMKSLVKKTGQQTNANNAFNSLISLLVSKQIITQLEADTITQNKTK